MISFVSHLCYSVFNSNWDYNVKLHKDRQLSRLFSFKTFNLQWFHGYLRNWNWFCHYFTNRKIWYKMIKQKWPNFYNRTKDGVDALDQKVCHYASYHKIKRLHCAIFYNIFDITPYDSYVIFIIWLVATGFS